jgi:hypothetical protein
MPDTVLFLQIVVLLGSGLAAARLFQNGLYRRYSALCSFLVFRLVSGTIPLIFENSQRGRLYFVIYVGIQPFIWTLYVLMVREVYGLALASHRGLHTLGRWAMYVAVVISVAVSLLSILTKITPKTPQISRIIGYVFAIDRGVNFALVLFILMILFFLSRYPVPLSRNVVRDSSILFVYFLSNTAGILLRSMYGPGIMSATISNVLLGIATLATLAWLFLITPAGEGIRKVMGIAPQHEQRILQQLDSLNATLLKISRN